MRLYELDYLISFDVSQNEVSSFHKRIQSLIKKEGGEIKKTNFPSKRELAYPIKEEEVAFLATIIFNLEPEKADSIVKLIKKEDNILRHIIFKKKKIREKEKEKEKKAKKSIKSKSKKTKVELEKIEEKLEEILKE